MTNLDQKVAQSSISLLSTASTRAATKKTKKAGETAGPGWYDMPAPEITPELERDLKVLRMRGALDRKRFYRGEVAGKSKFFQVGTVIASAGGFYSDRLTRKQRPTSFVDSLLKDHDSQAYYRKKFNELQAKYQRNGRAVKNGTTFKRDHDEKTAGSGSKKYPGKHVKKHQKK